MYLQANIRVFSHMNGGSLDASFGACSAKKKRKKNLQFQSAGMKTVFRSERRIYSVQFNEACAGLSHPEAAGVSSENFLKWPYVPRLVPGKHPVQGDATDHPHSSVAGSGKRAHRRRNTINRCSKDEQDAWDLCAIARLVSCAVVPRKLIKQHQPFQTETGCCI